MKRKSKIIFKKVDDKTIVWFQSANQYIIVADIVAAIIKKLDDAIPKAQIAKYILHEIEIPFKKALDFIDDVEKLVLSFSWDKKKMKEKIYKIPACFNSKKHYKINDVFFYIEFESELEELLVHPKFAHLEIAFSNRIDFHYQVFQKKEKLVFYVNKEQVGAWDLEETHFFQGKFSMQIVQQIHGKKEEEWMGVFHASAISDTKTAILLLGDSGDGKSTSLALLQANGYTCLADDFVPIAVDTQDVFSFPSAISIKKKSLETLLPIYPELINSAEYHFKNLHKIVRYLPLNNTDYTKRFPCKALVFIKYEKGVQTTINKIDNNSAFERLVPDSWLSPLPNNAKVFLDWFVDIPCYTLEYSNTQKMIAIVTKIFKDEL